MREVGQVLAEPQSDRQLERSWHLVVLLPAGLFVLLHLLAGILSPALWGADSLLYYGPLMTATFIALPLAAMTVPLSVLPGSLRPAVARASVSPRLPWVLFFGAIPLLWLVRVRAHTLGDSVKWFAIVENAIVPFRRFDEIPWHNASLNLPGLEFVNFQQALDLSAHVGVHALLHAMGGTELQVAYAGISIVAGGCYLVALWSLSLRLTNSPKERLAVFGFLASLGTLQLFCGYGESYTLVTLLCALYLTFAIDSLQGNRPLWHAAASAWRQPRTCSPSPWRRPSACWPGIIPGGGLSCGAAASTFPWGCSGSSLVPSPTRACTTACTCRCSQRMSRGATPCCPSAMPPPSATPCCSQGPSVSSGV